MKLLCKDITQLPDRKK